MVIQAHAIAGQEASVDSVPVAQPVSAERPLLPISIVNNVLRTGKPLVLADAPFLIGEGTCNALSRPEAFSIRRVDRVAVKGKVGAISLYEVLDAETAARRTAKEATRELLRHGMDNYFARDFAAADASFLDVAARDPKDAVAALFTERAARYRKEPPPDSWQGFETLHRK